MHWTDFYDERSPKIDERGLTDSLFAVVGATPEAPEAARIRERARELGELALGQRDGAYNAQTGKVEVTGVVRKAREGRDVAAERIWNRIQELAEQST